MALAGECISIRTIKKSFIIMAGGMATTPCLQGLSRIPLRLSSWEINITGASTTPKNSLLPSVITTEILQEKTD